MSPEAVNRAFRVLANRGIVGFANKRTVRILDRDRLEAIAAESTSAGDVQRRASPD